MFKHLMRGLLLTLIMALFALPSFAQTGDTFRVTVQNMNARSGPGIEYEVVARLPRSGMYDILQYSPTANWVLLDLGFTQAWAFRHLGEVSSPVTPAMMTGTITTTTTTVFDPSSLGQGGGFAAPVIPVITMPSVTETGVDLTVTSTQAEFNSTIGVIGTLRVRSVPSLNARILTAIPPEGRPTPLGRTARGTWIQVDYEGTVGWVYFLYVAFPPAIDVTALPVTG